MATPAEYHGLVFLAAKQQSLIAWDASRQCSAQMVCGDIALKGRHTTAQGKALRMPRALSPPWVEWGKDGSAESKGRHAIGLPLNELMRPFSGEYASEKGGLAPC